MLTEPLTADEAREGARILRDAIDARIDLALTPEVRTRLALRGITERQAREHMHRRALEALAADAAR